MHTLDEERATQLFKDSIDVLQSRNQEQYIATGQHGSKHPNHKIHTIGHYFIEILLVVDLHLRLPCQFLQEFVQA